MRPKLATLSCQWYLSELVVKYPLHSSTVFGEFRAASCVFDW